MDEHALTPAKAAAVLAGVVVFFAAYFALAGVAGLAEPWAGLLFLLHWTMVEEGKVERIRVSATGALLGTTVGLAPEMLGGVGTVLLLVGVLALVYCLILKRFPDVVSSATMLFLSVMTIPAVAEDVAPLDVYLSLLVAVVVFGGLGLLGARLAARSAPPLVVPEQAAEPEPAPVAAPLPTTRRDLYELAQRLDVPGRSAMTKEQLAEAVARAGAPV